VLEITPVELMDRRIIDEGETDFIIGDDLSFQHGADDFAQTTPVDRHAFLRAGDGDLAHERSPDNFDGVLAVGFYAFNTASAASAPISGA